MTVPEFEAREDEPGRLGAERLLAFSDGVVAIGLTLLVLPLADLVPEHRPEGQSGYLLIVDNLSTIGSFLLSFVVIGRFWMGHHRVFDRAPHVTPSLVTWNTLWLLTIVVLPFPTEMVGVYGEDPFTMSFYTGTLAVSSVLLTLLTVKVARMLPENERRSVRFASAFTTSGLLVLVFVLLLVLPQIGYPALFLLFLTPLIERAIEPVVRRRMVTG